MTSAAGKVQVIYHHFPHYRLAVMQALVRAGTHAYRFWGDTADIEGIRAFKGSVEVPVLPLVAKGNGQPGQIKISKYWRAILDRDADALIIIGNPNIRATWIMAVTGRLIGKKVLFWSHGWLRPEPRPKAMLRNLYFGLADRVLVYGDRAVTLAEASGFDASRISVIYNSLDYEAAQASDRRAALGEPVQTRRTHGLPTDKKILFCVSRLTAICQFDLLIEAAARLNREGGAYAVALVGNGPETEPLRALAAKFDVELHLLGAIYDEDVLAELFHAVDLTVSPGKIGLTAMHSLTYGVPAVTHGDLDAQMPEVEAIIPGKTGAFFERGSAASLALAIEGWFAAATDKDAVAAACREVIAERYTPAGQVKRIDAAVSETLNGRRRNSPSL